MVGERGGEGDAGAAEEGVGVGGGRGAQGEERQ